MTNPLANEQFVYVEWNAGDGGTHVFTPTWWLSPDVDIVAPVQGQATLGSGTPPTVVNTVRCRPHVVPGHLADDDEVAVQVFLATPGPSLGPQPPGTKKIADTVVAASSVTPVGTVDLSWTPSGNAPETAGHRCLVIRVFPNNLTPSSTLFFLEQAERHVAQHNIEVVKAVNFIGEDPQADEFAPAENGLWELPVGFVNLFEDDTVIGLTVDQDPKPHPDLVRVLRPLLKAVPQFEAFDTTPLRTELALPEGIETEPWHDPRLDRRHDDDHDNDNDHDDHDDHDDDHHHHKDRDDDHDGRDDDEGRARRGHRDRDDHRRSPDKGMRREQVHDRGWQNLHSVTARLPSGFAGSLTLGLDLRDTRPGAAQVLHVQQSNRAGRPQGGLTAVVVRVT